MTELGSNIETTLEDNEEPPILIPCTVCGRTFKSESLMKHQGVCQKNATKKRKVFDSMKQRIQGTDLAEYIPIPAPPPKPKISVHKGGNKSKAVESSHNTNTPSSSERSKPVVRSNSVSTSTPSRGAAFKEEKCPHCDRTFGWKAFSRHEEWCREHKTRVAQSQSPAAVLKAKEMLAARIKYQAPLVGKLKRPTNREKYAHHGAGVTGVSSPMSHSYHKSSVTDVRHQKISSPKSIVSSSNKENRNKSTPKTSTVSCPGFSVTRHKQVTRKVSAPVKREPSPPKEITHIINPPWDLNISNEEVEESKESSSDSRNRKKYQECCNELFKLESNEIELVSDLNVKGDGSRGVIHTQEMALEDPKQKPSKKEKKIIDNLAEETVLVDNESKEIFNSFTQERNCCSKISSDQESNINDSSITMFDEINHKTVSGDSQSGFEYRDSRIQILQINDMDESSQSVESLTLERFNHWGQGDINRSDIQNDRDGMLKFQIQDLSLGANNDKQVDDKKRQMNGIDSIDPIETPVEKRNINTALNSVTDFNTELSNELCGKINFEANYMQRIGIKKKIDDLSSSMKTLEQVDGISHDEESFLMRTDPDALQNQSLPTGNNTVGSNCSLRETYKVYKSVDEGNKNLTKSQKPQDNVTSWLNAKETAYHKNEVSTSSPKNNDKINIQKSAADITKGNESSKCRRSKLPIPFPKHCVDRSSQTSNTTCSIRDLKSQTNIEHKSSSDDLETKYQFENFNNTFILSDFERSKEFGITYVNGNETPDNQSNSFSSSCSSTSPEIHKGIIRKFYPEDYEVHSWKKIQNGCCQPLETSTPACTFMNDSQHHFDGDIDNAIEIKKNSFKEKEEDNLRISPSMDSSINEVVSYKFTNMSKTWEKCEKTNFRDVTNDGNKLFQLNNHKPCIHLKEMRKEDVIDSNLKGEKMTCSFILPNENDYDANFSVLDNFNKCDTPLLLEDLSTNPNCYKQQSTRKETLTNDTYILSRAMDKSDKKIFDMTQVEEGSNEISILERLNYDANHKISCLNGKNENNESARNDVIRDKTQMSDSKKICLLNFFSSATQNLKPLSMKGDEFRLKPKYRKITGESDEIETNEKYDSGKQLFSETESRNGLLNEKVESHLNAVKKDMVLNSSIENFDLPDLHIRNTNCRYEKTLESDNDSIIIKSIRDYDNVSKKESPRSECFSSHEAALPSVRQKIKHRKPQSPSLKYIVNKYLPSSQKSSPERNTGSGNSSCNVLLGRRRSKNCILKTENDKSNERTNLKQFFCGASFQSSPCCEKIGSSLKDGHLTDEEDSEKCRSPHPIFPIIKTSCESDIICNQMEWLNLIEKFRNQDSNSAESEVEIRALKYCSSLGVCKPFHYSVPKVNAKRKIDNHKKTPKLLKISCSKEETLKEGNQFRPLQRKLAEDRVRKRLSKTNVLSSEENFKRSNCSPRINSPVAPNYHSKEESGNMSQKQLPSLAQLPTNYEAKVRSCPSSSVPYLHQRKSSEDDRSAVSPVEKPSFRLSTYDPFSKAEMQLRELLSDGYETQNPKILLSSPLDEDQKKHVPDKRNSHTLHTDSSYKNGNLHLHNIFNNPKQAKEDVLPDLFTETSTQLHFEMPNLMRGREESVMTKRRAMKPTALNMGIDLNPSARDNPNARRNYMSKSVDSNQEYITYSRDGEISDKSHSPNPSLKMESGDHLDIDSIHQSINLVALGLSNLSTNSNESLVDVDNNNAMSGEKALIQKTNDVDSSGNLIAVDQKLILSSQTTHRHSSGESDGDAKRVRRRKRRGKTLPEGEARDDISSPESLVAFQNPATAKLSVDSAYSSLNRPSFRALEDCKRVINKAFEHHQHQNSSEGENDHADEWSDEDSKKRSSNWKPDPPMIDPNDFKLAKFCHECGSKYPLTAARFCCVCGVRRLAV